MKSKLLLSILFTLSAALLQTAAAQAQLPSGQRQLGQAVLEPGYDYRTGELIYIMTHEGTPLPSRASTHATAPLFIVVYPNSAANQVGTMNCAHEGGENCPDHGTTISDLAQSVMPNVYGNGVWGHDHIMDGVGGDDFNVTWHVVVVLFTNVPAANEHITTEAQLDAAIDAGDAIPVEIPFIFVGNLVSGTTYARGTPVQ